MLLTNKQAGKSYICALYFVEKSNLNSNVLEQTSCSLGDLQCGLAAAVLEEDVKHVMHLDFGRHVTLRARVLFVCRPRDSELGSMEDNQWFQTAAMTGDSDDGHQPILNPQPEG